MDGIYKFSPFSEPRFESLRLKLTPDIDDLTERFVKEQTRIQEWRTLMNIFGMKQRQDPLTNDVHIILHADKMQATNHIADAAEIATDTSAVVGPRRSFTFTKEEIMAEKTPEFDPVNKPKHYNSHASGVECIQVTRHMGFNLGNAIKYIWRADLKNDAVEDLQKAVWYLQDEIKKRTTNNTKEKK